MPTTASYFLSVSKIPKYLGSYCLTDEPEKPLIDSKGKNLAPLVQFIPFNINYLEIPLYYLT